MKTETFESTYALILRSDEKERSVSETVVYLVLIVSTVFSIWQAAHMRVTVPTNLRVPAVVGQQHRV
jgi:uncharacterized membrane protein